MNIKRCKHGMIENQCGVCQKWEERHWTQKEESNAEKYGFEKGPDRPGSISASKSE